jgi:hypothetical protein
MHHFVRRFAAKTTFALAATLAFASAASATTLSTKLAVDNGFTAYLSTSNSSIGTQFAAGHDWTTVATNTVELGSAQQYFLQIAAYDDADLAGLLGEFSLTGTGYHFADGSTKVLSGSTLLTGNNDGFTGNYTALTTIDLHNTAQWNAVSGIDPNARWVWARWYDFDNTSFVSLEIVADVPVAAPSDVPEPASLGLVGLGLLALSRVRARSKQK